jgi:16S rRNA (uracil1498-N3)-methyltransferase
VTRCLVEHLAAGRLALTGPAAHHLAHVRRMRAGDRLVLFDGAGCEAAAVVLDVNRRAVTLAVDAPYAVRRRAGPPVALIFALSKGDKPEWIAEKACELGAAEIVVFAAERSVVRWGPEQVERKLARLTATIAGACAQCGRADAPRVHFAPTLAAAAERAAAYEVRVAFDPGASESLPEVLAANAGKSLCLLSGPEGGLTDAELAWLVERGWAAAHLGPRVLRAETAALAALAVAQASLEASSFVLSEPDEQDER